MVQDIPLLVEGNLAPFFHLVVIVHADAELRVERLTTARGMDEKDARARIAAQATVERRQAVADVWLDNSGSSEDLARLATELWDERLVPFEVNVRSRRPAQPIQRLIAADPDPSTRINRVVNRLWGVLGERAGAIKPDESGDTARAEVRVTLSDSATDDRDSGSGDLDSVLGAGGFPAVEGDPGTYASADPGRPAVVRLSR